MMKMIKKAPILLAVALASAAPCASAQTNTDVLSPVWSIAPGERSYITDSHTERSLGLNPVTGNVLVVSRAAGPPALYVLDGDTGAELLEMDTFSVSGGNLLLNQVGVAEDGVIYAANVTSDPTTSPFKIYRWEGEGKSWEVFSTVAYEGTMGDVGRRWGDTFAVRGSGADTQILVSSLNSGAIAVFTTTDGLTFEPVIMEVEGVPSSSFAHGIAFGEGNTFWGKTGSGGGGTTGKSLKHCAFDLTTPSASLIQEYENGPSIVDSGALGVDVSNKLLAALGRSPSRLELFSIADLEIGPVLADSVIFPEDVSNSVSLFGAAVFHGSRLAVLGMYNGVMMFEVGELPAADAPSFVSHPEDQQVWPGDSATFSVDVLGASPITYQWFFDGQEIPSANDRTYTIDSAEEANAGTYHVIATNDFGSETSESATLTIDQVVSDRGMLTLLWSLAPGSRSYVSSSHTERALAVSPVTGNVYIPSRAEGADLYVVDGGTGEELLQMDTSSVSGGNLALNQAGVAGDGAIYAANVASNPSNSPFKIYRWESEGASVPATIAYEGTMDGSTTRWGDTFAVRGAGVDTQILVSSLNSDEVAVFTTTDGSTFTPTVMSVAGAASGAFAHGLAFGEGDTFWGKTGSGGGGTSGKPLMHGSFDLTVPSASLINEYADGLSIEDAGALGADASDHLLAAISRNHSRVEVYDVSDLNAGPLLLDTVLFRGNVSNSVSLFGAAVFHGNRLTVLGVYNGVMMFEVGAKPAIPVPASISSTGSTVTIEFNTTADRSYQVQYKDDLTSLEWLNAGGPIAGSGSSASYSEEISGIERRFYRAVLKP